VIHETHDLPRVILILDVGTTYTRCWVTIEGTIKSRVTTQVGVRDTAVSRSEAVLKSGIRKTIRQALRHATLTEGSVGAIFALGMATSELGLLHVPHCEAPAGVGKLAKHVASNTDPEIINLPMHFIPGVKNSSRLSPKGCLHNLDFMRAEETQALGIIGTFHPELPTNIVFLSSHTKAVAINTHSEVQSSLTTLSGQVFKALLSNTSIAHSVSNDHWSGAGYNVAWLEIGAELTREWGLLRAVLFPRLVDVLMDTTPAQRLALLEGALIESDLQALRRADRVGIDLSRGMVLVGSKPRCEAFKHLCVQAGLTTEKRILLLTDKEMEEATVRGALHIARCFWGKNCR